MGGFHLSFCFGNGFIRDWLYLGSIQVFEQKELVPILFIPDQLDIPLHLIHSMKIKLREVAGDANHTSDLAPRNRASYNVRKKRK